MTPGLQVPGTQMVLGRTLDFLKSFELIEYFKISLEKSEI